jgi:hypothetical protein
VSIILPHCNLCVLFLYFVQFCIRVVLVLIELIKKYFLLFCFQNRL